MSANAYEVASLLISAFGFGWVLARMLKAYRQFFDQI